MYLTSKSKIYLFLVFALCFFSNYSFPQTATKNCFEVKYLDFFGLDDQVKTNWSDEELNKLLEMDYSKNSENTRFFIPLIVSHLREFHPDCSKTIDRERFDKLVTLYFKVRQKAFSTVEKKPIEAQLNLIRQDFYDLIQDEKSLPLMKYTTDDGPIYGEVAKTVPKSKPLEVMIADFGKLSIIKLNNRIFLIATDKRNKRIWVRIMKGTNPNRYVKDLKFDKNRVEKTSLATIVYFYSEGEKLTLYLKPSGKFMYYYHSW